MNKIIIPRTLWYETDKDRQELNQTDLLTKTESMIILGDAGMGKSTLLKQISKSSDYKYCTARRLVANSNSKTFIKNKIVIVIDALDEVSTHKNGDSIDSVLAKLEELDYPRFILSCREADWHSATNKSLIDEYYSNKPLELHINAFNDSEILEYLTPKHGRGKAELVMQHFQNRGLVDLLGNPQTLSMLSEISMSNNLPENKAEIYKMAVESLALEHNDNKESDQLSKEVVLDLAGAIFAAFILTGSEFIARKAIANLKQGELSFTDLGVFPDMEEKNRAISTRLFSSVGNDRFSYLHRSIGEYLGARWLAKQVGITPRKKRRLLTLFQSNGAVPASLRGIHAWLAQYPNLSDDIIKSDPMGIIEYGDADNLNLNQGKLLLEHLVILASENPRFKGWKYYSARGLSQKELIPEISLLITNKDVEFSLRMLLLEILKGAVLDNLIITPLYDLVMDQTEIFAIRSEAINVLMDFNEDLDQVVTKLYKFNDEDSFRLAVELIASISCFRVSNTLIVDLLIDYAAINSHSFDKFYVLQRNLPDNRLAEILDDLAIKISSQGKWYERSDNDEISEFTCSLLVRLIKNSDITIEKLWYWLDKIQPRMEYSSEVSKELKELIYSNDAIRLELYKLVLFESDSNETLCKKNCNLQESLGQPLFINEEDIIILLDYLALSNHDQKQWRELVTFCSHNAEDGKKARFAAKQFAKQNQDDLNWLNSLAVPIPREWEVSNAKRKEERQVKKQARHTIDRQQFLEQIEQLRKGEFLSIIRPAEAYLGLYNHLDNNLPAHERIAEWLGNELSEVSLGGISSYLLKNPLEINADQIAKSKAENQFYYAEYIFIVAIAERIRNNKRIDDLSDEKLLVCLFSTWSRSTIQSHAKIGDVLEFLENEVNHRGLQLDAKKRFIEPQLNAGNEYVDGLHSLMRDIDTSEVACELASEWLVKFTQLSVESERSLLTRLMHSEKYSDIKVFLSNASEVANETQNWNRHAIQLIINSEDGINDFDESVDVGLIWSFRHFFHLNSNINKKVELIKWLISTFRLLWPLADRPNGVTGGRNNSWDATQFISSLITALGSDLSPRAIKALMSLRDEREDGYSSWLKSVIAEQRQRFVEKVYESPNLQTINAITQDTVPVSIADLQAYMIEELNVVQSKIKADDAESWQGFYDAQNTPYGEERCRDHLLGLLRQSLNEIELAPEAHVAADKRVDITCSAGGLRLPIEIKGQWHPDLWTSADKQLDALYASDWRAHAHGIYLIFWFGLSQSKNKKLKNPPEKKEAPKTAEALRKMLIESSVAAKEGRIDVFVLDVERDF